MQSPYTVLWTILNMDKEMEIDDDSQSLPPEK